MNTDVMFSSKTDLWATLIDLILDAKRTDPETGSFTEYLADYLINNGVTVQEWVSVEDRLPEMYDAGILKKIGIMQRSRKVIAAISDGKEWIVDNNAELRDGKWYSDTIRFLEAGKKQFKVTHWMPLPEPYKERRTDE